MFSASRPAPSLELISSEISFGVGEQVEADSGIAAAAIEDILVSMTCTSAPTLVTTAGSTAEQAPAANLGKCGVELGEVARVGAAKAFCSAAICRPFFLRMQQWPAK